MKCVELAKVAALAVLLAVTVVACKKSPKPLTPIPGQTQRMPGSNPSDIDPGAGIPNSTDLTRSDISGVPLSDRDDDSNYNLDREALRAQTVYFDFDSSAVRPDELGKVKAVADYLRGDPTANLRVEGHCDERGTSEYNRALGERRALSVRETLIAEGIAPDRISTLSFGEDQPAVFGSDDTAWAKNRRAEFVLRRPKT